VDTEKHLMMPDILGVYWIKIAFAERKIVDCIQEVRFPRSVITYKTIDLIRKMEYSFPVIFKIGDR
jgi:hypothetical protein